MLGSAANLPVGAVALVSRTGLDAEDRGSVPHVETPDAYDVALHPEQGSGMPIGFGLTGEQMLKTPMLLPSPRRCGGVCRGRLGESAGLSWKLKMTTMRCPGSISASPSSYASSISSVPSTSETRKLRGTFLKSVRANLISSISMLAFDTSLFSASLPTGRRSAGYPTTEQQRAVEGLDTVETGLVQQCHDPLFGNEVDFRRDTSEHLFYFFRGRP